LGDQIREEEGEGHVARMGEMRLEGKRPLVRPRRRWEDITRMDLRELE